MAAGFTETERETIREQLKASAWAYAKTPGMRKTTVEELCQSAGISKGAFYHFYDSKEMLFFEIMEECHERMYGAAKLAMEGYKHLPPARRLAEAVLTACTALEENGLVDFFEYDLSYLLRKIPPDVLMEHYSSDDDHIREILSTLGPLNEEFQNLALAVVRALLLTLSHQKQIGLSYEKALRVLVEGACDKLFQAFDIRLTGR